VTQKPPIESDVVEQAAASAVGAPALQVHAALLPALLAEAARWQASALGARALRDAALKRREGILAAEAAVKVEIYDEVVARLFGLADAISSGSKQAPAEPSLAELGAAADADAYRVAADESALAARRYAALLRLCAAIKALPGSTAKQQLRDLVAAIRDRLPDFAACGQGLRQAQELHPSRAEAIEAAIALVDRASLALGGVEKAATPGSVDAFVEATRAAIVAVEGVGWPGGKAQAYAENVIVELRRLLGEPVLIGHLRRLGAA